MPVQIIILLVLIFVVGCFMAAFVVTHREQKKKPHYYKGALYDDCIRCHKRFFVDGLLYNGTGDNPMCRDCIIKEAQEKFGKKKVTLRGREN